MSEQILEQQIQTYIKGESATVKVGNITYGTPDSGVSVENVGDETNAVLNFRFPNVYGWANAKFSEKLDISAFIAFQSEFNGLVGELATKDELTAHNAVFTAFLATYNADKETFALKSEIPTIPTTWDWDNITNKPTLFSGSYNDLTDKPNLFSGSYNDLTDKPNLFSGDYNDLTNKPDLSLKTINGQSILGVGNIEVQGGGVTDYNDLTNKPDLSIYATKDEIPEPIDTSDFLTNEDGEVLAQSLNELNERVNGIVVPDTSYFVSVDTFNSTIGNIENILASI